MNDSHKLAGLLGMARRAGRLSLGFDAALAAVNDRQSALLLTAADASAKTEKECRFTAEKNGVDTMRLPLDKAALSAAIGAHKPVAVIAVCDEGFAGAIRSYVSNCKEENSL